MMRNISRVPKAVASRPRLSSASRACHGMSAASGSSQAPATGSSMTAASSALIVADWSGVIDFTKLV